MRPAADGKNAHDIDLQRDHRAGAQADREIEPEARAWIKLCVQLGVSVQDVGGGEFAGVVHGVFGRPARRGPGALRVEAAIAAETNLGQIGASCCACRRFDRLQAW